MSDAVIASNDRRLTAEHVGSLVDAQGIVNFFAYLLYDTDRAIPLDHASLGLDSVDLRQQIRTIRRIGEDPADGDIVIYLFEARSVTVALTQTIARRFRERPESALLVVTKDYETLDFVLVERELAAGKKLGSGLRQIIRPRTLSVNRRNPDPVSLRVLQRFTFTESDSVYQWEKLRSAFTLAEWTEQYFNNRALFSDYYLLERLTDPKLTPQWEEDVRPMGREVLRQLAGARAVYSGKPEQALRNGLYEPLFRSLGFEFAVHKPGDSDLDEPDYVLYAAGDRTKPLVQVMTYVWNRNLDDADDTRDHDTRDEIPGALVVNVLAKATTNWVVVTNGKLWRLYSATAANKATNYYEIDLEEAAHAPDQITALKYWWLFFRRQAFTGFLDGLLQQSADYAKGLGERLKDRTFTTIFPHFARGFIEHQRTGSPARTASPAAAPADLDLVFRATMTFLYRLMFILYAESLNLLPATEERGYGEFSLARLKRELAKAGGKIEDEAPKKLAQHYGTDSTERYQRLQLLFNGIDAGDPALNLPMYNGGLFSDATPEGRFLADHAIPDRYLALGLDRLCRDVDDKTQALALIDYKSLGVRQLGSIYEGLLEFKLRIASEPLVVVREKGKEVYLPAREAGGKRAVATLAKGDVYLENDKRERKATGSYYTPDYIVTYIVEHTVGPVLADKFAALEPRLREAQKLYRQNGEMLKSRSDHQSSELFWERPTMQRLADDCLDVRVLDPAMGSGHFLVEAVDFVGDRLIQFLNAWSENPVWALLARTRQDILADMDRQGVSIDEARLTRVSLLKRSVLKRCIYGVDLNPMAVELAKVSLWLDAFTLGAPLSFLDHHLKCGNSLIGALDLSGSIVPGTERWNSVARAAANIVLVSKLVDATPGEVVASAQNYKNARRDLEPTIQRLNVSTAAHFADLGDIGQAQQYAYLDDDARKVQNSVTAQKFETAQEAAGKRRFFHWKLEFPEVFIDDRFGNWHDDGGFDIVIGNPPWGSELTDLEKSYFEVLETDTSTPNSYIYFCRIAELISNRSAHIGLVLPDSLLVKDYAKTRKRLINEATLNRLAYLSKAFEHVNHDSIVIIFERTPGKREELLAAILPPGETDFEKHQFQIAIQDFNVEQLEYRFNLNLTPTRAKVYHRLSILPTFGGVGAFHEGIHTGNVRDRLFYRAKPDHPALDKVKPCLIGSRYDDEFGRYYCVPNGNWVIYDPAQIRKDRGEYASLRDEAIFLGPKIYVTRTGDDFSSFYDEMHYASNNLFSFKFHDSNYTSSYLYYLALLNSAFSQRFNRLFLAPRFGDLFTETKIIHLDLIPVPDLKSPTTQDRRAQLATKGRALYQRCLAEGHACVLEFVAHHLARNESDVIHDLLAFLAGQMIELNKQKQAEVKRFLGWLEGRLKIRPKNGAGGIDSLTGKTIIQGYLGDYQKGERETSWADFYYRLHQNRNRFAASLEQVRGEIEAAYEQSLAVLLPIKRQLAATDALIDQIVYELYGLTEEEIAIVEGPAYQQALSDAKAGALGDKALQTDEARAEAIAGRVLPAAERLRTQVALSAERSRLDQGLPGWHLFPDEVVTFLLTAEYNIASQPDFLDFSTSVISYAKAVEAMLYHRLFVRFRGESGAGDADCKNKFLQEFMRGERHLTLGSMSIALASSKEAALRTFAQQLYPRAVETFFAAGGVAERINDQAAVDLRNAAAHDETLTREDARIARAWALGILQYL